MATLLPNTGLHKFGSWTSLGIRALLLKSTAVPTVEMDFVSDIIAGAQELTVTGYARKTLAGLTRTVDDTNDWQKLSHDVIAWTGLSGADQTAGWLVLYEHNAADSAATLMVIYDIANIALGTTNTAVSYGPPTNGIRLKQGA